MHRLYRHPTDKVIGGVAAGLGVWMNVDPTIVRLAWVVLAIFTGGMFLVIYFVMLFVVPLPPQGWMPGPNPGGPRAWPAARPARPRQADGPRGRRRPPPVPARPRARRPTPPRPAAGRRDRRRPRGWTPPAIGNGNAGIVGGVILVLLGAWFLVDQYVDIDWTLLWPVLVMLAGVALIVLAARRGRTPG